MTPKEVEDLLLRAQARRNQFGDDSHIDVIGAHLEFLEYRQGTQWAALSSRLPTEWYHPLCSTVIHLCEQELWRFQVAVKRRLKS